jgi:hypothetical protein
MLSLTANALPLTFAVSYLSCQIHSTKTGLEHDPRITGERVKCSVLSSNKFLSIPSDQKKKFGGSGSSLIILTQLPDTFGTVRNTFAVTVRKSPASSPGLFHSPDAPSYTPHIVFKNVVSSLCSDSSRDYFQNKS